MIDSATLDQWDSSLIPGSHSKLLIYSTSVSVTEEWCQ